MNFITEIRRMLGRMGAEERRRAVEALRELIYEDAYERTCPTDDGDNVACRRCGSLAVLGKGHDRDGIQRWVCKDCHRTFRDAPDTIITRSRLKPAVWMRYLECFVDLLPLRECAKRCKVSLRSAWLMRMRLIESIRLHLPDFHAGAGMRVQLDETYLWESFKGNHTKGQFTLPRPPRHRGTPASRRGLSREQICVMTGVDDMGGAFLAMSGRGLLSKDRALATLHGRLDRGAYAVADAAAAYPPAMKELGVEFTGHGRQQSRNQPREHAPLPARGVSRRIPRREHETAGRIPRMVPMEANLHAGPGEHRRPSGQRHPMRQHRARLGARDAAVHGLLGRHGIDCMYTAIGKRERNRAWRTPRPPPCASTPR